MTTIETTAPVRKGLITSLVGLLLCIAPTAGLRMFFFEGSAAAVASFLVLLLLPVAVIVWKSSAKISTAAIAFACILCVAYTILWYGFGIFIMVAWGGIGEPSVWALFASAVVLPFTGLCLAISSVRKAYKS